MAVLLNHTIVPARDKHESARFLSRVLGVAEPKTFAHFVVVQLDNGVSLDFDDADEIDTRHFAFLVDEDEFDEIFDRVKNENVRYYADPGHRMAGEINTRDGGRGFYFDDPDGHNLEILTRPYGSRP